MHSINYFNTLIAPPDDCKAVAKVPEKAGSIAQLQYAMIMDAPLTHTSDDVLVAVTGTRKDVPRDEWDDLKKDLFSKGQPCFRASPLVKTHGWAIYSDRAGRVELVDPTSGRFAALETDLETAKVMGMRNQRR